MRQLSREQMRLIQGKGWEKYFNSASGIWEWVYVEDQPCEDH